MEEFSNVAKARASYKLYLEAMSTGRDIMRRAGVPDPPPIPEFDAVFRKLDSSAREALYRTLDNTDITSPAEAVRVWTPFVRRAFGAGGRPPAP